MNVFRHIIRPVRLGCANYSNAAAGKLVSVSVNDAGIATLTMQRMPVNSLNLELLSELGDAIDEVDSNSKCKGLILTSASKTVFSAGLDITEMYKPDKTRCSKFWSSLQDTWMKLYNSRVPSCALINGHSPAGGCLLAMSCEYRIMLPQFTIGLNETQLGIVAPFWFISTMRNTIGARQSELALTSGRLFSAQDALKINLIDEIAENVEDGLKRAEGFFGRFAKVHPLARQMTKVALRGADVEALMDRREEDLNQFLFFVFQDKVQQSLEAYITALKAKKQ